MLQVHIHINIHTHLSVELLGHWAGICLAQRDLAKQFSKALIPIYTPTSNVWEIRFLYIVSTLVSSIFCILPFWWMFSGLSLNFPDEEWGWVGFVSLFYWLFGYGLLWYSCSCLLPIFFFSCLPIVCRKYIYIHTHIYIYSIYIYTTVPSYPLLCFPWFQLSSVNWSGIIRRSAVA